MPEKTCNLCGCTHSEDVGSHIITEALTRSCFNQPGKSGRGNYEEIHRITPYGKDTPYVGSAIDGDRFKELTGQDFTDELGEENRKKKNRYINQDLVCRDCERRFGPVESHFISKVLTPMNEAKIKRKDHQFYSFSDANSYAAAHIFFLINIWRMSVSKFNDWSLAIEHEKAIGAFLNDILGNDRVDATLTRYNNQKHQVNNYRIVPMFLPIILSEGSESGVLIQSSTNPYFILLNQIPLLFSVASFDEVGPPSILSEIINKKDVIISLNSQPSELVFQIIEGENRKLFIKRYFFTILNPIVDKYVSAFTSIIRDLRISPSQDEIRKYTEAVRDQVVFGYYNKLNDEQLTQRIAQSLEQFCVQKSWR